MFFSVGKDKAITGVKHNSDLTYFKRIRARGTARDLKKSLMWCKHAEKLRVEGGGGGGGVGVLCLVNLLSSQKTLILSMAEGGDTQGSDRRGLEEKVVDGTSCVCSRSIFQ